MTTLTYIIILLLALVGSVQVISKITRAIKKVAPAFMLLVVVALVLYAVVSTSRGSSPDFTASSEPNWDEILKEAAPVSLSEAPRQ